MTTAIKTERVPKGFSFPVRRKQLREIISGTSAPFSSVVMAGISMSERFKSKALASIASRLHAGILTAYRNDDGWYFSLEINALRDSDFSAWRAAAEQIILQDIVKWIQKKQALPETAPLEPSQLFLGFEIKQGECCSTNFEAKR